MNQCTVFASEVYYNLTNLYSDLRSQYKLKKLPDIIYLQYKHAHVFVFSYGTVVSWLASDHDNEEILSLIKEFESLDNNKIYSEQYAVAYGDQIKIIDNTIYINQESITSMLAISIGLAQSEKLGVFEHKVDDLIKEIQPLYQYLAKFGKISLSRSKISKKIGQLFSVRSFINLQMSILDTPDFFWEREELEPIYQTTIHYLELKPRMHALNSRMNIIQELYDVLHNELQTKHSHRLEWIIIILIFIEVILSLYWKYM